MTFNSSLQSLPSLRTEFISSLSWQLLLLLLFRPPHALTHRAQQTLNESANLFETRHEFQANRDRRLGRQWRHLDFEHVAARPGVGHCRHGLAPFRGIQPPWFIISSGQTSPGTTLPDETVQTSCVGNFRRQRPCGEHHRREDRRRHRSQVHRHGDRSPF